MATSDRFSSANVTVMVTSLQNLNDNPTTADKSNQDSEKVRFFCTAASTYFRIVIILSLFLTDRHLFA